MRKPVLFLFLFCIPYLLMAQSSMSLESLLNRHPDFKVYEGVYRYTPAMLPSFDLSDSVVLDKSRLKVTYDVYIVSDTTTGVQYHDRMIVLVGDKWEKSYGEGNWMSCMLTTLYNNGGDYLKYSLDNSDIKGVISSSVYKDKKNFKMINRAIFPEQRGVFFIMRKIIFF